MATYQAMTRTNYFKTTDEERLRNIVSRMVCGDRVEIFENNGCFGFGAYDSIQGVSPEDSNAGDEANASATEDDECYEEKPCDYDLMIHQLQEILPDGEVMLIFEVGHEKLRSFTGDATVLTNKKTECINLQEAAVKMAQNILGNPNWDTRCEY